MEASRSEVLLYCLTRDRDLASAIDAQLTGAIGFFYNDAARLHQAVVLRRPDLVVVDTGAIRDDYGDAGLGPVISFLRHRAPEARIAVRPRAGSEWLIAAETAGHAEMLPAELEACVEAVAAFLDG